MKIFIDTADIDEIKEAYSWGIVDGVTTNPSLIKKAVDKLKAGGKEVTMEDYIGDICLAVDGPVSL
ncbi:MAG TPA: transaldolase, partial [Thermoplasmatales archaeon]|nr:transaldolase [Thermoplasmatales archaeon]